MISMPQAAATSVHSASNLRHRTADRVTLLLLAPRCLSCVRRSQTALRPPAAFGVVLAAGLLLAYGDPDFAEFGPSEARPARDPVAGLTLSSSRSGRSLSWATTEPRRATAGQLAQSGIPPLWVEW